MIGAVKTHAKSRGLLLGAVAVVAIALRLRTSAPPPRTVEGVAQILGTAAGASVKPDDFLWEDRGGYFADTFLGRRVLFLASVSNSGATQPRDLYRARVRLTRGGRPIAVSDLRNLTHTPLGDDRDLAGSGHRVAFATATLEGVQGVTLLDLDGDSRDGATLGARIRARLERWLASGTSRGLARTEIAFASAPTEAKFEVGPSALVLALGADAVPLALDFTSGELVTGHSNPFAATAQSIPEAPRAAAPIAVDLTAAILGDSPARALAALLARASRLAPAPAPAAVAPDGLRLAADYPSDGGWPPAPLVPVHPRPFEGEGFWHVAPAVQSPEQQVAPPPMLEAIVRPDPNNPDAIVHLVAIDTRRLSLRIQPGVATPVPATGPRGSGRLPTGPDAATVVAAFTLGPPATARPLGFFAEGRLFSPLVAGAPALAVRPDGHAELGPWPETASRDAFVAVAEAPDALAPLSEPAPAEPAPFAVANAAAVTDRSALCRTTAGYLIFAHAAHASAASLQAGLKLASCASALHLAAAPSPLGFAYLRATLDPAGTATYAATPASSHTTLALDHPGEPWPSELVVVTRRELVPATFTAKKLAWLPDTFTQPPPAWLPGVFALETEQLGARVKLTAFLPDRVTFRVAAGTDEGATTRGARPGPAPDERTGALAALGLSVSRRASRRGLLVAGTEVVRPSSAPVWLVLDGARVTISRPGEPLPARADATEVPLVADEHKLLPSAREVGTQRPRSALCVLPDGTVIVAHTSFDTDEATTEALLDVGCDRVVALDRGAHDGVFVDRAGSEHAPAATYEPTAIYVLPAPGVGTTRDIH